MTEDFDFSAAIDMAQGVANASEEKSYPYPLVYPSKGQTLIVKLLFNPKSGLITKKFTRHKKIPCYRTYNMECPICKIQQQVKDTLGSNPFGNEEAKTRGVSFATFISSTKPIEVNKKTISPGDTILLMYPYSVYTGINNAIAAIGKIPSSVERAFKSPNEGFFVQITVSEEFKYNVTGVPFMTFATGLSDAEYIKMLQDMPSLADQVVPSTLTQEVNAQVSEYVNEIYGKYIAPKVPNQNVTEGVNPVSAEEAFNNRQAVAAAAMPIANPQQVEPSRYTPPTVGVPYNPSSTGAPYTPEAYSTTVASQNPLINQAAAASNSKPSCFSNYVDNSPRCICCPHEVECVAATAAKDPECPFE